MAESNGKKKTEGNSFCNTIKNFLLGIFLCYRFYFDLLIDKIFSYYYDSKRIPIKNSKNPIILHSASELARKIRQKELTVVEVVQAFIDRINEVNPVLNSVVDNRFKDALAEAKQLDYDIGIGHINDSDFQEKPFLGVPFTTKESTSVKGLSSTFGVLKRKGKKALFDAECVEQLKKAGGICLGVTNIPQLNMWQETNNPIYGVTNNPYNTTRNVGGSSGGESSIIAACGSPMGIGTDIGGSIRIPAFMCGIFGHKPTSGLTSTNGLTFRTGTEKDTIVVVGPMVKYAKDLSPFLKVLVSKESYLEKLRLDEPINVKNIRIFYIKDPKDPFISPFRVEMKMAFKKTVEYFADISNSKPEALEFPGTKYGGKLWRYWMTQEEGYNFKRDLTDRNGEVQGFVEITKHVFGKGDLTTASIFNILNSYLPKESALWAVETTNQLRKQLLDKLQDNGILLYPSGPWPANYHHTAYLRPWNFNLFAIWNALKFPVTQVPLGLSKDGLPLGIQVVAAPYQDRLCIAVAKELEKEFGGYVPPFQAN